MKKDFCEGDTVIVVGGVVDNTGVIETLTTVCIVEEVGAEDLLVKPHRGVSAPQIVSQSICVPVKVKPGELFNSEPLKPRIGDMVFYRGKLNWRDKEETTLAGTVYEIKFRDGRTIGAVVHTGDEMIELQYDQLMVLQKKTV